MQVDEWEFQKPFCSSAHAEVNVVVRQLYLDSLTQVANRYQIDEWMTSFIDAKWEGQDFSIIFFDIDY